MTEELAANLSSYRLQLQQVETALETDQTNEDLLKLKSDLEEIISLTEVLIGGNQSESKTEKWKIGDQCRAIWSKDQQFYPAKVEEILGDGTCTVVFEKYGTTEIVQISSLRQPEERELAKKLKSRKDISLAQREYKKKKSQKKAQRLKQQEDERELDKHKWEQFNAKIFSKTNKGKVKKSIFASPDTPIGRVGVGTCGVSGKPMTRFFQGEKYNKKS